MKSIHILMIGAGRMAEAIISGLVKHTDKSIEITVTNNTDENRLQEVGERYSIETASDWRAIVTDADVVISAAPPSAHAKIFSELSPLLNDQVVISVAAGIDTTFMEAHLPVGTPVAWIMPNTAAQLQTSISTYVCGYYVTSEQREIIKIILTAIGDYEELTEEQVHDLTAITGSAPAFLYSFCEALEEAAIRYGTNEEQARKLVTKMLSGSAAMLEAGNSPNNLRQQVTTPGGSTAAGLEVLEAGKFQDLINAAVRATNAHARGRKN